MENNVSKTLLASLISVIVFLLIIILVWVVN